MPTAEATGHRHLKQPGLQSPLKVAAWVLIPAWLYIHAFVWAADSGREVAHYLTGPPWWLFMAASVLGFYGGPIWVAGAIAAFVVAFRRGAWPARGDLALFAVLGALITLYVYLMSLD